MACIDAVADVISVDFRPDETKVLDFTGTRLNIPEDSNLEERPRKRRRVNAREVDHVDLKNIEDATKLTTDLPVLADINILLVCLFIQELFSLTN